MARKRRASIVIDPREVPLYTVSQAAYVVGVAPTTLNKWFYGRDYVAQGRIKTSPPIIAPADRENGLLSFSNLGEAHVLEAIRKHRFTMKAIREAVEMLREYGPHPLISWKFYKSAKRGLFVRALTQSQSHTETLSVSRPTQGQVALGDLLDAYLERIERDEEGLPVRLFPMRKNPHRHIMSDLYIASGEPVIAGTGILAQFVFERHKTGESIPAIAKDYEIDEQAVEDAIDFVSAA